MVSIYRIKKMVLLPMNLLVLFLINLESWELGNTLTSRFEDVSFVDWSKFIFNKESCSFHIQLVELEDYNETNDVSGCHHYTNNMPYIIRDDFPLTLFDPINSSQTDSFKEYEPNETYQEKWYTLISRKDYVRFLSSWFNLWNKLYQQYQDSFTRLFPWHSCTWFSSDMLLICKFLHMVLIISYCI